MRRRWSQDPASFTEGSGFSHLISLIRFCWIRVSTRPPWAISAWMETTQLEHPMPQAPGFLHHLAWSVPLLALCTQRDLSTASQSCFHPPAQRPALINWGQAKGKALTACGSVLFPITCQLPFNGLDEGTKSRLVTFTHDTEPEKIADRADDRLSFRWVPKGGRTRKTRHS